MLLLEKMMLLIKEKPLIGPGDHLLLAVSGGVDSVVLCDLCHNAGYRFTIAHCNFQLRGEESERDEAFVKALGKKYQVDVLVKKFDTRAESERCKTSIEETARDLRYNWFHELLGSPTFNLQPDPEQNRRTSFSYILTAHHADDNIETLLMNFFRGTGIKGLHGILPRQRKIIRPLLFAWKSELEEYARENKLEYVTDHTNTENTYTRNFFRNEMIPLVEQKFPEVRKNLFNNINRFAEAETLYRQAVENHKKKLMEKKGNEWHIPVLKLGKSEPIRTLVHEIIGEFGFTTGQVDEVITLLNSESGRYVQSHSHRIIRNRKWLVIAPNETKEATTILIEKDEQQIAFPLGSLKLTSQHLTDTGSPTTNHKPAAGPFWQSSNDIATLDASGIKFPLLLRKWKTGDYFYPLGMRKKKKLSRFFIDQKLSKTQKESVWVIESDRRIVWVIGLRIDDRFKITGATNEVLKITFDI